MHKDAKIYVAGHRGMVGSAIVRKLRERGFTNIILRTSSELDLRNQAQVQAFFAEHRPEIVYLAAAKVGGILANNTFRADFIYDNIMMETNVIHSAYAHNAEKLVFLGSSCIYPKMAEQPMREDALLTDTLEPTNEPYAIAKIAGIKLCEAFRDQYGCDFISLMPTNLYGPNDNYDLKTSHVLPALIRKFHEAKMQGAAEVVLWGTGKPLREFMHVDDLADATLFLTEHYSDSKHINVGTGEEITIGDLATLIQQVVGFEGNIVHDTDKPDGTPRKLMDSSKLLDMGWKPKISLEQGIASVYQLVQQKGFDKVFN